jgi:hypothetical protein
MKKCRRVASCRFQVSLSGENIFYVCRKISTSVEYLCPKGRTFFSLVLQDYNQFGKILMFSKNEKKFHKLKNYFNL